MHRALGCKADMKNIEQELPHQIIETRKIISLRGGPPSCASAGATLSIRDGDRATRISIAIMVLYSLLLLGKSFETQQEHLSFHPEQPDQSSLLSALSTITLEGGVANFTFVPPSMFTISTRASTVRGSSHPR